MALQYRAFSHAKKRPKAELASRQATRLLTVLSIGEFTDDKDEKSRNETLQGGFAGLEVKA